MKVVINVCFGGFGLSDAAYEKLIEWGVPVQPYYEQQQGPTGLYLPEPRNAGEVIFDRALYPQKYAPILGGRYWESWLSDARTHPLLVRVVEELGTAANGHCAQLRVVVIPDGTAYEIDEYDGNEHIAEEHRTWR